MPDGLPSTLPLGLSLRLAAKVVGVSPNTFRRLERDKLMPSRKLVGGRRLYDRDDLLLAFRRAPTIDGGPGTPPPALIDPAEDHSWDDLK
jgi:MerR HTH family regulatory protein